MLTGQRPSKPGQRVMIVGSSYAPNNGITGVTIKRFAKDSFVPGLRFALLDESWLCEWTRTPMGGQYVRGKFVPGSEIPMPYASTKMLIVIADPDIDTSDTEPLKVEQPEGVPA